MKHIVYCICAVLLAACTMLPQKQLTEPETVTTASEQAVERSISPHLRDDDPENMLNSRIFDGLPSEARSYLIELAWAFRNNDRNFILYQGEKDYFDTYYPKLSEAEYLALLYRTEAYASPRPDTINKLPQLNIQDLHSITYTAWEERGPLIEVRGIIRLKSNRDIPCRLMILWRLPNILLLGERL